MTKLPINIVLIAFSLLGCADDRYIYRNTSTMQLCMSYLTLPSINIHQSARAQELSRRGENCNQYLEAAGLRQQKDAAFDNQMRAINAPTQPQNAQPSSGGGDARGIAFLKRERSQGFNKICFYDRLGSEVAITIGITDLCPLTL